MPVPLDFGNGWQQAIRTNNRNARGKPFSGGLGVQLQIDLTSMGDAIREPVRIRFVSSGLEEAEPDRSFFVTSVAAVHPKTSGTRDAMVEQGRADAECSGSTAQRPDGKDFGIFDRSISEDAEGR